MRQQKFYVEDFMRFSLPLEEGSFLKRYKRFFADVDCKGKTLVTHVPNTGSLKGCLNEGALCRWTLSLDPKRKVPATLQMIQTPTSWVGVNTATPNILAWEAFHNQEILAWKDFEGAQKEVKINEKSRIDMVLWKAFEGPAEGVRLNPKNLSTYKLHFVEVKNVTMAEDGVAFFPDCVTTRGQKHLQDLIKLLDKGHSAEVLFTVQRTDCREFRTADHIDPTYGRLFRKALEKGVKMTILPCRLEKEGVFLQTKNPLKVLI